jgi:chorismate mutase
MVNNDTWQLFFDMQNENPFADAVRQKFIQNLETLTQAIMLKKDTLEGLRENIEKIDNNIISLLSLRLKIAQNIGISKQKKGSKVIDHNREKKLINLHHIYSRKHKINQKFTDKVFSLIIQHSRAIQRKKYEKN